MPRMQVYLPDELYRAVKEGDLPASELLQHAVRAEVRRLELLRETDRYVAELIDEVGEPSAEALARAEALSRRIRSDEPRARQRVTRLVLDSGGVTRLARRRQDVAATIAVLRRDGLWPPLVPTVVLVESLSGRPRTDVLVNRLLKICDVVEELPQEVARRAGALRALAGQGSAVDAVVVAMAEPGGAVLGSDLKDLRALAAHADHVTIHRA